MADKLFIGKKQILETSVSEEKTAADNDIIIVKYKDETVEHLSKTMFDAVVSPTVGDDTQLRDRRIKPVVEMVLSIMREWGIKTGELQYFSVLLNSSLDHNTNQALLKLVSQYMPAPLSLDDVDLITVDRILKALSKPEEAKKLDTQV